MPPKSFLPARRRIFILRVATMPHMDILHQMALFEKDAGESWRRQVSLFTPGSSGTTGRPGFQSSA